MKQLIIRHIINASALKSYLILNAPFLIGISIFIGETLLTGAILINPLPIVAYFYPFPYLMFNVFWMEVILDELMKTIDFNSNLNTTRLKKLLIFSKWSFTFLSSQTIFMALIFKISLNIETDPNPFLLIFVTIITILLIALLLVSVFTFFYGRQLLGKLLVVIETQKPYSYNDPLHYEYKQLGSLSSFKYFKIQKRIKKALNGSLSY
ncbi:hypothetical protein AAG747_26605 [Rapidithrix thailandica]|uniref:Uncharacterized protein n=1 Tax=Rapidithrix thailandica TaxID=413964 RepID=A0AAW9S2W9_9BACT